MNRWNRLLLFSLSMVVAVGIGCRPSPLGPVNAIGGAPIRSSPNAHVRQPYRQKIDNFDLANPSMFEVNPPHKIEDGMLHLQASKEGTILPTSAGCSYIISAQVMPPEVGEQVGLAFAQSEHAAGWFYLYRSVGEHPLRRRCYVGLRVQVRGQELRQPELRIRQLEFQPDTPIKLSVRHSGSTVTLSINDQNVGRIHEGLLNQGRMIGVYGKSQREDGSSAIVKFDSVQIAALR